MTSTKSINRWGQEPRRELIHRFIIRTAFPAGRRRIGMCLAIMLFCLQVTCFAGGSGPEIGIKIGAQTFDSDSDFDKRTRARFEVEIASPRFGNDYFDVALIFGGSSLGSFHDEYEDFDDDVLIEEYYSDHYSLFDLRLAARLYPLGDNSQIKPYVGGGVGYFWFLDSWKYEYYETYADPYVPGVFHTYGEIGDGRDTIANGLFPFVTAGLMVPVASNFELQFEFQYHYDKQDSGFDLSGPVYMFGCLFRF
jgi:hypothetical protein